MADKPKIPDFPNLPDFGQMITQACEVVANVRGIPYDFNGTLSLENKFVVLFKTVKEMFTAQDELVKSYKTLHDFINQYFTNLDLQNEVNKKIEEMKNSGELLNLLKPTATNAVTEWLTTNITNPSNPPLDKTLTIENAAADSKVTGDHIDAINKNVSELISYERQFLFSNEADRNKIYINNDTVTTDASSCTYPPFKIRAGIRYYYSKLRNYFCWIKDLSTGNFSHLSDTDISISGSYTPVNDSEAYITGSNDYINKSYWSTVDITTNIIPEGNFDTELINPKYDYSQFTNIFYCGAGKEFTTFKSVLNEATKYKNSIIYLLDGVYDIFNEEGGNSFFDTYKYSDKWYGGLVLKNGVKIYAGSNAVLKFQYNGNNTEVKTYYSPLNAGTGGFELHNVTLVASNCRYCIHDERTDNEDMYRNVYDHCNIIIDNSNNNVWEGRNCIGGGLGKNGEIYIHGCVFESKTKSTSFDTVSYHNSINPNAKSRILIENTILKGSNGRFKFGYHGTSTDITDVIICGCKAPDKPLIWQETETDTTVNMEITEWNNIWTNN